MKGGEACSKEQVFFASKCCVYRNYVYICLTLNLYDDVQHPPIIF